MATYGENLMAAVIQTTVPTHTQNTKTNNRRKIRWIGVWV